ncbi:hypothetical protein [Actinomadura miaoliensis]|uniref:Glutamine amidotransferase type-2 domain-containing protein n=1 Tax=Actinomadura miaoliensis TaxID=430685 RepID=A0ABP7W733_9ACTN
MYGLFGVLRSPGAGDPGAVSDALVILGTLAEERGRDTAGIALFTGRAVTSAAAPAGTRDARGCDLSYDGCRVVTGRAAFSRVWRPELLPLLDVAPLVVGHTGRAAPESPDGRPDAGPLVVPGAGAGAGAGLVGTHDGDVAAERIFRLLAGRRDAAATAETLGAALPGRAALAWVDRARPDRVHLARAARSPLTVAVDTEQNLYWASEPCWLRTVQRHTRVRFATAVMLREGTYLRAGLGAPDGRPHVLGSAGFTPTARGTGEFAATA